MRIKLISSGGAYWNLEELEEIVLNHIGENEEWPLIKLPWERRYFL